MTTGIFGKRKNKKATKKTTTPTKTQRVVVDRAKLAVLESILVIKRPHLSQIRSSSSG